MSMLLELHCWLEADKSNLLSSMTQSPQQLHIFGAWVIREATKRAEMRAQALEAELATAVSAREAAACEMAALTAVSVRGDAALQDFVCHAQVRCAGPYVCCEAPRCVKTSSWCQK